MLVGWSLFIKMTIELNRTLPRGKKFFLIELRQNLGDVKRLHEERFPISRLRAAWVVLLAVSVLALAAGVVIATKPQ